MGILTFLQDSPVAGNFTMCVLAHLGAKMFKSQLGLLNCVFKKGILLQVPFSTLNCKKKCFVNRKVIVLFHLLTSVIQEE